MSRHSSRDSAWKQQRKRVLDRDQWVCVQCGKHLEGSDATVDHVEPKAHNPDKTYRDDELVSMCRRCNGIKQDRVQVRATWVNPRWLDRT